MSFIKLSPCCLSGGILAGEPRGVLEPEGDQRKIARYRTRTRPSSRSAYDNKIERQRDKAIVLFTDPAGLSIPNPKIIADSLSDALGLEVFVPQYYPKQLPYQLFDGIMPLYPEQFADRTWYQTIFIWVVFLFRIWRFIPMLISPSSQMPLAQDALIDLRSEGYKTLGAIGYCRGAAVILHLLHQSATIDAAVLCHPSPERKTYSSLEGMPTCWQLADPGYDPFMKLDEIAFLRRELDKLGGEWEMEVHKDTVHGFASRPMMDHEPTRQAFEKAHQNAIAFFSKHLLGKE
ncbi:hypothetical protein I302_108830 [Kwoniella bestiolae CBS 10118]|uniref:Dienelactone hydrolase domain-containing protein n=1 Tax=Kwoniella bestiolae CBS 10118 TaxID=1296100 RepID=A0AAJ8KF17_9TREE